jgi:predicted Zn-dependent protease
VEQAQVAAPPSAWGLKLAAFARETARANAFSGTLFKMKTAGLLARLLLVMAMVASQCLPAVAAQKKTARATGPSLIRDAEIEGLLRLYVRPIFKVAGVNGKAIKVYVIADRRINAFVSGGQRIFIHTGLITRAKTPNEVIGVLAHETGHIAGGHLARMGIEAEHASIQSIIGMLAGAAAIAGGAISGNKEASKAGSGIIMGSQGFAQRGFLSYQRSMESAADQAAIKYLAASGQSAQGMVELFRILANESLATAKDADPYLFSHPMPFERLRILETAAKKSAAYDKADDPALLLRHQLAQAKLAGFMESTQYVYQRYPSSNKSMPARYARAITMFRKGDIKNAMPLIDGLIDELPQNPYFWELKGQAYLENGNIKQALAPLAKANELLPNNGLIQILHAQALLGLETKAGADQALKLLSLARKTEADQPSLFKFLAQAYAQKGDIPRAELATAEFSLMVGDLQLAAEKARAVQDLFKHGSPEWLRANDILNFASKKK